MLINMRNISVKQGSMYVPGLREALLLRIPEKTSNLVM